MMEGRRGIYNVPIQIHMHAQMPELTKVYAHAHKHTCTHRVKDEQMDK